MDESEPGGLIEDVGGVVKEVVSLLTFSEGLRTIHETATCHLGPGLSFLRPCLSMKKVGKHKGIDWTRCVVLHLFPDCMDLVSMQCTVEVALTVKKQKDSFLIFP